MSETVEELADRALRLAAGAPQAQVSVLRERSLAERFARSRPTQATAVEDTSVGIVVLDDGHPGRAETNDLSDDALRATARRAQDAARAAREAAAGPGSVPPLPTPAEARTPQPHAGLDEATTALEPRLGAAALREAAARCEDAGREAFGLWTAGHVTTATASSTGLAVRDEVTDAHFKVIARDADGRSGWGAQTAVAAADIDAADVAGRALARVARSEPRDLPPGEYPVVLEPDAVGALLEMLAGMAFDGLAHGEGRGVLHGRLGTRVASPIVTLVDAPHSPDTLPRAVDADGVAKMTVPLIRDGVAEGIVHDRLSAARAGGGAISTGHALVPGGSPWGARPTNLVLFTGDAPDLDALIAPVERGIYITRLWYLNVVHERSGLVTGTSRDGTFLIEDGRVTAPVRDVRFTDRPLEILERTEALTEESELVSEADFYGRRFAHGTVAPALRAAALRVTGATSA